MISLTHPNYGVMLVRPSKIKTVSWYARDRYTSDSLRDVNSSVDFGDNPHCFNEPPAHIVAAMIAAGVKVVQFPNARAHGPLWFNLEHITVARFDGNNTRLHIGAGFHLQDYIVIGTTEIVSAINEAELA